MKYRLFIVWLGTFLAISSAEAQDARPAAQPPRPANKNAGALRATYLTRVNAISRDLQFSLLSTLVAFDGAQKIVSRAGRRRTRVDPTPLQEDEEFKPKKAALLASLRDTRANCKRLRAISPVPRTFRKADNDLIDAGLEIEQGVETLVLWADHPIGELELRANRELRKGMNDLDAGLHKIARLSEPAITRKVYLND